jgi:hypothetical protein
MSQISSLAEDGVANSYYWSNPRATVQFFDFVRANDEGRLWTFTLLDSLWLRYNRSAGIDRLGPQAPEAPTEAQLNELSDDGVADLLTRTRRLKNQTR